jgi:hypothetical protein
MTNNSLNTNFVVTGTNKALTQPSQPIFAAKVSNMTISNVTGDGTKYFVLFDSVTFDVGSNYTAGSGTYTAPVTGRYLFTVGLELTNLGAGHTQSAFLLEYNSVFTDFAQNNPQATAVAGNLTYTGTTIIPLTATNTVRVSITVYNSTKTVGVLGAVANGCWFHGFLLD